MKFRITYEFDATYGPEKPFWASSEGIQRCGASFAEARAKLIEDLKEVARVTPAVVPEPEEVEL